MHPYCYAPLLLRPNPSCPQCKNPFDTYPPKDLGEKAVPEREDQWNTLKRKRNRPSGAGSSRANGDNEDEDEEEDADDFEEEEMEGSVSFQINSDPSVCALHALSGRDHQSSRADYV